MPLKKRVSNTHTKNTACLSSTINHIQTELNSIKDLAKTDQKKAKKKLSQLAFHTLYTCLKDADYDTRVECCDELSDLFEISDSCAF